MTALELRRRYAALPEWRRPVGSLRDPHWSGSTSTAGLREALYDLASDSPRSIEALAADVREHWGEATDKQVAAQVRELVRAGAIVKVAGGYVRKEQP